VYQLLHATSTTCKNQNSQNSVFETKKVHLMNDPWNRKDLIYQALSPTHSRQHYGCFHREEKKHSNHDDEVQLKGRLERTVLLLEGRDPRSRRPSSSYKVAVDKKGWRENELVERRRLRNPRHRENKKRVEAVAVEESSEEEEEEEEDATMLDTEKKILLKQMLRESSPIKKSSRASILLRKECFIGKKRAEFNRYASLNALCPVEPCEKTLRDLPEMFRYKPIGNRPSQKIRVVSPTNVLGHERANCKHVVYVPNPQPDVYRSWKYPLPLSKTMEQAWNKEEMNILKQEKLRKKSNIQRRTIREQIVANNRGLEKPNRMRFKHIASIANTLQKLKRFKSRRVLNRNMSSYASNLEGKLSGIEKSLFAKNQKKKKEKKRKSRKLLPRNFTLRSGRRSSGSGVMTRRGSGAMKRKKDNKKLKKKKQKKQKEKELVDANNKSSLDSSDGIVFHSLAKYIHSSDQHFSEIMGGLSLNRNRK